MSLERMAEAIESDFRSFYQILEKVYSESASCNIYFTANNASGRIIFERGLVQYIGYANKRGLKAIALISNIQELKYRIGYYRPVMADDSLPDTQTLLEFLTLGKDTDVTEEIAPSITDPNEERVITEQEEKAIHVVLQDMFGPMADYILEDHEPGSLKLADVVSKVLNELTPDDIPEFKEKLQRRLGRLE